MTIMSNRSVGSSFIIAIIFTVLLSVILVVVIPFINVGITESLAIATGVLSVLVLAGGLYLRNNLTGDISLFKKKLEDDGSGKSIAYKYADFRDLSSSTQQSIQSKFVHIKDVSANELKILHEAQKRTYEKHKSETDAFRKTESQLTSQVNLLTSQNQEFQTRNDLLSSELTDTRDELSESNKKLIDSSNELTILGSDKERMKKQEIEFKESKGKYEEMIEVIDKSFDIIDHDLKKPFLIIESSSKKLIDQSDGLVKDELSKIRGESKRAKVIFDKVQVYAKLILSRENFEDNEVDLKNEVDHLFVQLKPIASNWNIKLINDLPEHLLVLGNEFLVASLFRNLVVNAMESIERANGQNEKVVRISGIKKDDNISIYVEDSGSGVPEAIKGKIFKQKVKSSNTNERKGIGTDLCRRIMERMKGKIEIDTTREQRFNTTIRLDLPSLNK